MRRHGPARPPTPAVMSVLMAVLGLALGAGAGPVPWELTLQTSPDGSLGLLAAAPLPETRKGLRSPGAAAPLLSLPVTVAWLDASGHTLLESSAALPLGTRIPTDEDDPRPGLLLGSEVCVVRLPGPPAADAPAAVRISTDPHQRPRSLLPSLRGPVLKPRQVLPLAPFPTAGDLPLPGTIAPVATKIRDTGPDANRFVLVILGDGYTQAEIDNRTFRNDVAEVVSAFAGASPWDDLMAATNIYEVSFPSAQSGCDYEDGPPGTGTTRNTYYHTGFFTGGTERLLAPTSTGRSRCIAVANTAVGLGSWDQIILIVNSDKYGGSGGMIATNSMHPSGPTIAVHEVGHSFAGLADEYDYADGAVYADPPPTEPNVDTNGSAPKWSHWLTPGTPLPTPDSSAYGNSVGAFEGARYHSYGIYRPWRSCRMRSNARPFCPVCKEEHLRAFFSLVDFTESVSPSSGSTLKVSGQATLSVDTLPVGHIRHTWRRDGLLLAGENGPELVLSTAGLPAPTQTISLAVDYVSPLMRTGAPQASFSWTVRNTGETADGVPHWWLATHGLDTADAVTALDHDADGMSTGDEFLANTDPRSRGSLLRLHLVEGPHPTAPGLLRWTAESGRDYTLESSPDLERWDPVPGYVDLEGTGAEIAYVLAAGSPAALHFRVVARLP